MPKALNAANFDAEVEQLLAELLRLPKTLRLERGEEAPLPAEALHSYSFVLVPGAFHREYPQHGGGGEAIISALERLGADVVRIPLPSFCSVPSAAQHIREWFAAYSGPPVVLLSLSKGSADVMHFLSALRQEGIPASRYIRFWVSVCGLSLGTPMIAAIQRERLRFLLIRLLFFLRGYRAADLETLSSTSCRKTAEGLDLDIESYHIVALPRFADLSSRFAHRAVQRIWCEGSSDGGGVLLRDYALLPGSLCIVEGNDHYFKKVSVERVLQRVLHTAVHRDGLLSV